MSRTLDRIRARGYEKFGEASYRESLNLKERELQLAELLADRRIQMNINQAEMAQKLATSQQQISKYEHGESIPKLDVLWKLLDILDLEMVVKEKSENNELLHV